MYMYIHVVHLHTHVQTVYTVIHVYSTYTIVNFVTSTHLHTCTIIVNTIDHFLTILHIRCT